MNQSVVNDTPPKTEGRGIVVAQPRHFNVLPPSALANDLGYSRTRDPPGEAGVRLPPGPFLTNL